MGRQERRRWASEELRLADAEQSAPTNCWLCGRLLGSRIEWHHPKPKSRGGRITVPVHPICHRTIHACFSNTDLERMEAAEVSLGDEPEIRSFLRWIAGKHPDFHAPTRGRK
ncbi:HNH endonuclease [Aureimonas psammosilenae]|uniref:HNH endonuclease n=1 Tax=Aureimonas psammosilenae TaxID=2495496 RepID=UPI0012611287|nr:HNH endonuclease [Aureimonas psammosilenae]